MLKERHIICGWRLEYMGTKMEPDKAEKIFWPNFLLKLNIFPLCKNYMHPGMT